MIASLIFMKYPRHPSLAAFVQAVFLPPPVRSVHLLFIHIAMAVSSRVILEPEAKGKFSNVDLTFIQFYYFALVDPPPPWLKIGHRALHQLGRYHKAVLQCSLLFVLSFGFVFVFVLNQGHGA